MPTETILRVILENQGLLRLAGVTRGNCYA